MAGGYGADTTPVGVTVMTCEREDISACIAAELMKYSPTDVYAIAPITVKKFGLEPVFRGVKNCLVERGCIVPLSILAEESKYNPGDQVYYCGGARKLKGTERKVVILVGAEIPYTDYGIDMTEYLKALYVCISRAIDRLIIIFPRDVKIDDKSPIAQVIKCDKTRSFEFKRPEHMVERRLLATLRVKDDISATRAIDVVKLATPYLPPFEPVAPTVPVELVTPEKEEMVLPGSAEGGSELKPPPHVVPRKKRLQLPKLESSALKIRHNEDFVGLYIEALLALKVGADVSAWMAIIDSPETNIKFLNRQETLSRHSSANFLETLPNNTYCLLLRNGELPFQRDLQIAELRKCIAAGDLAYVLCVLNYSSQLGKWWIASREVFTAAQTIRKELNAVVDAFPPYLGVASCPPSLPPPVGTSRIESSHSLFSFSTPLLSSSSSSLPTSSSSLSTSSSSPPTSSSPLSTSSSSLSTSSSSQLSPTFPMLGARSVGRAPPQWGKRVLGAVKCDRSKKLACEIIGIADLVLTVPILRGEGGKEEKEEKEEKKEEQIVLEIKYAQHKEAHIRQTSIYSALLGMKGMLVNLAEGLTFTVLPANQGQVDRYCRVALAIKNGKSSCLGKRIRLDGIAGAVLVALDIESDGFPPHAPLLEVGGAAWYWGTEEIEDTFCELARGVRVVPSELASLTHEHSNIVTQLTGLVATEESNSKEAQDELRAKTKKWFKGIHGRRVGLTWGSCGDLAAAGIKTGKGVDDVTDAIDLHKIYVQWLALNGISRKGTTKLRDAVEHLCPDFPVRYHVAFEDVVATIFVANCILEFAGSL